MANYNFYVLSGTFTNALSFFQKRQDPFLRCLAVGRVKIKKMWSNKEPKSSQKSVVTWFESCAFIMLMVSTAQVGALGSEIEVPSEHLYHFNPCTFNPMCFCSTGGKIFIKQNVFPKSTSKFHAV